jgi:hypothetical protein
MLSEKQFRERARSQLRQIGSQLRGLATDRDVYWKLEHEIVRPNPQLHDARSAVLDMVRGCYVDGVTARVNRLLKPAEGDASLPAVLAQLAEYPQILHDKITEHELAADRAALQQALSNVRQVTLPRAGHHERTLSALSSAHRELDAAIDLMISTVRTYYWIINESYIDLDVSYGDDPLAIFQFAWAVPMVAEAAR